MSAKDMKLNLNRLAKRTRFCRIKKKGRSMTPPELLAASQRTSATKPKRVNIITISIVICSNKWVLKNKNTFDEKVKNFWRESPSLVLDSLSSGWSLQEDLIKHTALLMANSYQSKFKTPTCNNKIHMATKNNKGHTDIKINHPSLMEISRGINSKDINSTGTSSRRPVIILPITIILVSFSKVVEIKCDI